jgi:hypothetical protein
MLAGSHILTMNRTCLYWHAFVFDWVLLVAIQIWCV